MKKVVAIILTVMLMMTFLVGCSDDTNMTETSNMYVEFWTDEETGVQYVVYKQNDGYAGMGGITPRLDADGSLYD